MIGGAGYIGSILCRQLLAAGYSVRVLDALFYGDSSLRALFSDPRFDLRVGDSRDVTDLVSAMREVDFVVHLGEIVGDPACGVSERTTRDINLTATRTAAQVAKGQGVKRFVYASSCSVYGASDAILTEGSQLNPLSLYARAKIAAERALLDLRGPDFHPVILRLGTVFGLSPRPRSDLVVNLLTARAVVEREILVMGGHQWRPFVHVSDVARAMAQCLRAPLESVDCETFNVGSDSENYTIQQVGEVILQCVPGASLNVVKEQADPRNYRVSFAKMRTILGFEGRTGLLEGVAELRDALAAGAVTDYRNPQYSNLRALDGLHGNPSLLPASIDYLAYVFDSNPPVVAIAPLEVDTALQLA